MKYPSFDKCCSYVRKCAILSNYTLYLENYNKTLMKKIEGNTNRWKDKLCLWIGRINIAKMTMGKTWPEPTSGPAVSPNTLGTQRLTGMNPYKDTPPKLR